MATTLRMQRHGNTHRPFYHIVAANSRASATKKFLEKVGSSTGTALERPLAIL